MSDNSKPNFDKMTFDHVGISQEHHEVHEGDHYFTRNWDTIATSGVPTYFSITTPNSSSYAHLIFSVTADNLIEMEEWEGATIYSGVSLNLFNSNRNSANTCGCIVKQNVIISGATPTSGTLLARSRFGVAGLNPTKQGIVGNENRSYELILKSGTTYLWQFKPGADTVILNWDAHWYEHINKI